MPSFDAGEICYFILAVGVSDVPFLCVCLITGLRSVKLSSRDTEGKPGIPCVNFPIQVLECYVLNMRPILT